MITIGGSNLVTGMVTITAWYLFSGRVTIRGSNGMVTITAWYLFTGRVTIGGSNLVTVRATIGCWCLVTGRMTIRGWRLVTGRMVVIRLHVLGWNVDDRRANPKWLKVINCCYRRKPTLTDQKSYDLFSWQHAESERSHTTRELHSSCRSSRH